MRGIYRNGHTTSIHGRPSRNVSPPSRSGRDISTLARFVGEDVNVLELDDKAWAAVLATAKAEAATAWLRIFQAKNLDEVEELRKVAKAADERIDEIKEAYNRLRRERDEDELAKLNAEYEKHRQEAQAAHDAWAKRVAKELRLSLGDSPQMGLCRSVLDAQVVDLIDYIRALPQSARRSHPFGY